MTDQGLRLDLCYSDIQNLIARQRREIAISFGIVEAHVAGPPPTVTIGGVSYRYIETADGVPLVGAVMAVLASSVGTVAMGALSADWFSVLAHDYTSEDDDQDPLPIPVPAGGPGDLIVANLSWADCGKADPDFNTGALVTIADGWTAATDQCLDTQRLMVTHITVPEDEVFSIDWGHPAGTYGDSALIGFLMRFSGVDGVSDFQSKESDAGTASGSSEFPTATVTVPGSVVLYGTIASGPTMLNTTYGDTTDPGLADIIFLGTTLYDTTTWNFYEIQDDIGVTEPRSLTYYSGGQVRLEWTMVIDPA